MAGVTAGHLVLSLSPQKAQSFSGPSLKLLSDQDTTMKQLMWRSQEELATAQYLQVKWLLPILSSTQGIKGIAQVV